MNSGINPNIAVTLILMSASSASANDSCINTLIQDRGSLDIRDISSLAAMRIVQQSSGKKSGWSGNITVPIKGVTAGLGASSSEEATNSYFDNSTLNWDRDHLESAATQTLSKNAVEAYQTCVHGNKSSGPSITIYDARPGSLTVAVRWIAPPGAPAFSSGAVTFQGGKAVNGFPLQWYNNQTYTTIIKRELFADFRIVANIGGESDNQLVSYLPEIPPPVILRPVAEKQLYTGLTPNVNAGEVSNASYFKNGANLSYGFSIKKGSLSGDAIYLGTVDNVNAGMINTSEGAWRGGGTVPFGYVIVPGKQSPKDKPLYVGADQRCAGAVADNPGHQGCAMQLLGYAYVP